MVADLARRRRCGRRAARRVWHVTARPGRRAHRVGGASLAVCAGTNLGMKRLTGVDAGRRAVDIQKTMNVAAPLEDVFEFWSAYENFPRFMANVRDVRATGRAGHSHWTVSGPVGSTVEF